MCLAFRWKGAGILPSECDGLTPRVQCRLSVTWLWADGGAVVHLAGETGVVHEDRNTLRISGLARQFLRRRLQRVVPVGRTACAAGRRCCRARQKPRCDAGGRSTGGYRQRRRVMPLGRWKRRWAAPAGDVASGPPLTTCEAIPLEFWGAFAGITLIGVRNWDWGSSDFHTQRRRLVRQGHRVRRHRQTRACIYQLRPHQQLF
jgi:hypothetical protein